MATRTRTIVLWLMVVLLFQVTHVRAAGRHALLIGINDYTAAGLTAPPGAVTPSPRDWANLDGAVADVAMMRELILSLYGFTPADVEMLKDQQATRAAILRSLERLAGRAKKGDVVLFYYSGHGSQVSNPLSAEADKMDESLVPADSRLGADDVRDKEMRDFFNVILDHGARLTVVLDSCHSGSGARGLDGELRVRSVKPGSRQVRDGSKAPLPEDRGALVLAAAQDFDDAFETRDDRKAIRGAFSWALARALRDAEAGEPVRDTFLRAQARLSKDKPAQQPVLAGRADVLLRPFLGVRNDRREHRPVIAVEKATPAGTYIVQGGWANGVTVGSELRVAGQQTRLEVTKLVGVSRAEARLVTPLARGKTLLESGSLLEIARWAAPPTPPLRVWIPRGPANVTAFVREWKEEAARRAIRWVDDPTRVTPTHLLRWRGSQWELVAGGHSAAIGATPLSGLCSGASLFVQLPVPAELVDGIVTVDGVELTSGPGSADYILAGRFTSNRIEYAWVRPQAMESDGIRSVMPVRTAWSSGGGEETGLVLRDLLMRLRRVHGWHELASPVVSSPYRLALRGTTDGALVDRGQLIGTRPYRLVMCAKPNEPPERFQTRYRYAFVIDSHGTSVLLFPRPESGSVENRLPLTVMASEPVRGAPSEIPLGGSPPFTVSAPYGLDSYFLLSTEQPLLALASLEWDGVDRGEAQARSPLEDLLALTLSGARGNSKEESIRTPPTWSLEKFVFESVPPEGVSR